VLSQYTEESKKKLAMPLMEALRSFIKSRELEKMSTM